MINDLRNIVYTILNKENRGELSPVEFNGLVYTAQLERFKGYLTEYRASVVKTNRGFSSHGLANAPTKIAQLIDIFGKEKVLVRSQEESTATYGVFELPEDCAWLEQLTRGTSPVDLVERDMWINVIGNSKTSPSESFPMGYRTGNTINARPSSMESLRIYYIRYPKRPNWTYRIVNGNPVFNGSASDFQDIELHESEFPDLVYDVCSLIGINLKDGELSQQMEMMKYRNEQKENIV